jgi:hypothetical protein
MKGCARRGRSALCLCLAMMVPAIAYAATPTFVQQVSSSTNPQGPDGNNFRFTLPNAVGAGNCIILGVSYPASASRTVTIADNLGNAWPVSPAKTVTSPPTTGGVAIASSVFVLPNALPGVTTIRISFDTALHPVQYTLSE